MRRSLRWLQLPLVLCPWASLLLLLLLFVAGGGGLR